MTTSHGLWLKLSAHFHEHPKMLYVRRKAGRKANDAELGWYRILMAAKRYGRWDFASEEHLLHVSGQFAPWISVYREANLLNGLRIHDGDDYNAAKTPAERQAEKRERDRIRAQEGDSSHDKDVTPSVTPVTVREEKKEREEREESLSEEERDRRLSENLKIMNDPKIPPFTRRAAEKAVAQLRAHRTGPAA